MKACWSRQRARCPRTGKPREQTLFRSTAHGDDVDRPVKKSDGSWTYFAPTSPIIMTRFTAASTQLIDVFGADHGGYVKRMKAAVSACPTAGAAGCQADAAGAALQERRAFKMSKRAGNFVTLRDVVDQVGPMSRGL